MEVFRTERPGHATEIARHLAGEDGATVISMGGDGTHHEVINGLMPSPRAAFAVLPAGTGNDFVRILNYPTEPEAMLAVALSGALRTLDLGRVNDAYFLTVAGVGFDAEVANWVNGHKKSGSGQAVFIRAIVKNLFHYRAQPLRIGLEDREEVGETFMVAAANTAFYAGGLQICPHADPADGRLAVVWIGHLSRIQVLPMLARVMRGSHLGRPQVRHYQSDRLTVSGPESLWVHADGELIGHLPVTIQVIRSAIRVRSGPL